MRTFYLSVVAIAALIAAAFLAAGVVKSYAAGNDVGVEYCEMTPEEVYKEVEEHDGRVVVAKDDTARRIFAALEAQFGKAPEEFQNPETILVSEFPNGIVDIDFVFDDCAVHAIVMPAPVFFSILKKAGF